MFQILSKIRNFASPRALILSVLGLCVIILLPWSYQESWLDPFSTLNVPNRLLHPHSFTRIGYIDPTDPQNQRFTSDKSLTQELIKDLASAKPLIDPYSKDELKTSKVSYFVLHRDFSRFHEAEDFSLQFYPELNLAYFGDQEFKINEATTLLLDKLPQQMNSGWWK